jgi:multidrug efflux pump subunit AcrB
VVTADGRSVPLGDVADVAVRKLPEMIRNDNGSLAGYIYVDLLQGVTGPITSTRAAVAREEPDAADRLHASSGPACTSTRRGRVPACASSCRSRSSSSSGCS